jgi:hypothetical protein
LHFDAQAVSFLGGQHAARKVAVNLGQLVSVDDKVFGPRRRGRRASAPQGLQQNQAHHPCHSASGQKKSDHCGLIFILALDTAFV